MTLTEIRAAQHNDLVLDSDHALIAYLGQTTPETALNDYQANLNRTERRLVATAQGHHHYGYWDRP